MKTLYEVLNIDLADQHTKARKLSVLDSMGLTGDLLDNVTDAIEEMDIPADDERHHWIQKLGRASGVDLLTIGKVQPEHMNYMVALEDEAFAACVKQATAIAKQLNYEVQQVEAELQTELASEK